MAEALKLPQEEIEIPVDQKALVIGGGVAGIQAALDIADAGFSVTMVEKEPSIGGRMAQIDKTFPTMDCSICILAPKMAEVGRHHAQGHQATELEPVQRTCGHRAILRRACGGRPWPSSRLA